MLPSSIREDMQKLWKEDRKIMVNECAESIDRLSLAEIILLRRLAVAGLRAQVIKDLRRTSKSKKKLTR